MHRVLIPGLHAAQWGPLSALATRLGQLHAVGTHPASLADLPAGAEEVPAAPGTAVAIGECGLDAGVPVPLDRQVHVLEAHLALARETGLPILLHCLSAHRLMLDVLRRWAPVRGVMHAYSGGPELVREYVALGLHLSFAGSITWERARKPVEALRRVPLDRLLLETDAPDLCPRPHRGRNEPAWLVDVVDAAERARGEPVRAAVAANAAALGWG